MSILKFTKMDKCPICGCEEVVAEYFETFNGHIHTHCNGTTWEHRKFACGCEVGFNANFCRDCFTHECNQDPKKLHEAEQNKLAYHNIIEIIDNQECSENFKNKLKDRLAYLGGDF